MLSIYNLEDTQNLAYQIFIWIQKYNRGVFFEGPLGIGKSTIISIILSHFGFKYRGSPTYIMAREYTNNIAKLVHIDLYQSTSIDLIYYDEYIPLIEWPSKCNNVKDIFHKPLHVNLQWGNGDSRECTLSECI